MWDCILKECFGIYCVGCGGTRMLFAIFRLDFYQAFRYNPGMFVFMAILAVFTIFNIIRLLMRKNVYIPRKNTVYFVVCILFIYMILRNVPGFEYLIPTDV